MALPSRASRSAYGCTLTLPTSRTTCPGPRWGLSDSRASRVLGTGTASTTKLAPETSSDSVVARAAAGTDALGSSARYGIPASPRSVASARPKRPNPRSATTIPRTLATFSRGGLACPERLARRLGGAAERLELRLDLLLRRRVALRRGQGLDERELLAQDRRLVLPLRLENPRLQPEDPHLARTLWHQRQRAVHRGLGLGRPLLLEEHPGQTG